MAPTPSHVARAAVDLPPHIVGVDFSGAGQAGRKVWVTLAQPAGDNLRVTDVRRAAGLPGGAAARTPALAALVAWLRAMGPAAVGLDFPFGLHRSLVPERSLRAFVAAFRAHYADAQAFRVAMRAAGRSERDLKRACDLEARTPFAPHNLRVYRQTWHGIAEVLAPLCAAGACLLPMEPPQPGRLWLLEACPASALKARDWYHPYKGRGATHREARAELLRRVEAEGVAVPRSRRAALLDDAEGDALDSVLCTWIAWRAVRDPAALLPPLSAEHGVEGYVYA
ncbi:MAG TPA: DUF429 domain-containing protein [bacterium]|nr:DUF429 domain-containing protein [bacterium]